jgi:hypothetical protein
MTNVGGYSSEKTVLGKTTTDKNEVRRSLSVLQEKIRHQKY